MPLTGFATRQDFSVKEATASALMSEYVLAMEAIYKCYIRITQTYIIQSSSKRHLMNLLSYRSQVEENTGYNS